MFLRSILIAVAILVIISPSDGIFFNMRYLLNSLDDMAAGCAVRPENELMTPDYIRFYGYPVEEHPVVTEDGFILTLHRIPGPPGSKTIFLQHGLLESSFVWVLTKGRALAFILADRGYDVWMGNARGNVYSRNHTRLSPSQPQYWDFSWDEMGRYDLPAAIKYVTRLKNDKLIYIGHSMGCTMFFVMASERPEAAKNVSAMFGLAPASYGQGMKGPAVFWGTLIRGLIGSNVIDRRMGIDIPPQAKKFLSRCICSDNNYKEVCRNIFYGFNGYYPAQYDEDLLPLIAAHQPAGVSLKTMLHFSQLQSKQSFSKFDYGPIQNLKIYGSIYPSEYNLSKIQVPVALFYSDGDWLVPADGVKRLYKELPNSIELYRVEDPGFTHLDFVWGKGAPKLVYMELLQLIRKI